jgi:translation initiation factor 1
MSRKKREGIVYSTDPGFSFEQDSGNETVTLPAGRQQLFVWRDSKSRKGKTVTLVKGFSGNAADLEKLARDIKTSCGTGGSAKDGEIIIQGDFRDKIVTWLTDKGYRAKKAGG